MTVLLANLIEELKILRKGRGLFVSHIDERVGVTLRTVCEVTEADGPAEIRYKVGERLGNLAKKLPPDLRIAVMAAFAIVPDARLPLYQDRVSWAAAKLNRDPRTARRRIDDGIHHLAQLATMSGPRPVALGSAGWHTEKLRLTLVLDRGHPEVLEQRRIIADSDGLTELDLATTVTGTRVAERTPTDLGVNLFHGGTLMARGMEASDRFGFSLRLPAPLARGDVHEFALRLRPRDGLPLRPHFACVPRHACDLLDLRVRFDPRQVPDRIRLLEGVFQRDLDDVAACGEEVVADPAGDVHVVFSDLTPGMAYGVRWNDWA